MQKNNSTYSVNSCSAALCGCGINFLEIGPCPNEVGSDNRVLVWYVSDSKLHFGFCGKTP